jgi:hypothetical protein
VNRNVAVAAPARTPAISRSAPPAVRPRPRFKPGFFSGAHIVRCAMHPETGVQLSRGEVVLGPVSALGDLAKSQPFKVVLYMSTATYDLVTEDDGALTVVQEAIARWDAPEPDKMRRMAVGIQTKMVDASIRPGGHKVARPVGPQPDNRDLELFVTQVLNLFTDIQGFDMTRMTGEVRLDFFNRYNLLRDKARTYRELMAQLEGSFEVLQRKMLELAQT